MPATRTTVHATTAAISLAALASPTLAEWPASDTESLRLGQAEALFFGPRQSIVATPDAVWVAWQDSYCTGDVRLQRIATDGTLAAPGGVVIQPDPTCGFAVSPLLAALGDRVVATRWNTTLADTPVIAYDADASPVWDPGFTTNDNRYITQWASMPNGDLLTVSVDVATLHFDRLDANGDPVWPEPTTFAYPGGSNFKVHAAIPDDAGGFYIVIDSPTNYTRTVTVQRFDANGKAVWPEYIRPVTAPPLGGISRHTPPVSVADGQGGFYYLYTMGRESGTTTAPILLQQINADGSLTHPVEGLRVSTDPRRQFDPAIVRHEDTGDLDIVWRNGPFNDQEIFAQRISPDGSRRWTDAGIAVASTTNADNFDAALLDGDLVVAESSSSGVAATRIGDDGTVADAWSVSSKIAANVSTIGVPGGVILTWQADGPELADTFEAARLNRLGRLGNPACNPADLAAPVGVLDLADLAAFIPAFLAANPGADLAPPAGTLDLADVQAFVTAFTTGCP